LRPSVVISPRRSARTRNLEPAATAREQILVDVVVFVAAAQRKGRVARLLIMMSLILAGAPVTALMPSVALAEAVALDSPDTLTIEQVRNSAAEAGVRKNVDVPTKARIAALSRAAVADLERVPELHAEAQRYRQLIRDAPDQARDLERKLETLQSGSGPLDSGPSTSTGTLIQLVQTLAAARARQATARAELAGLDTRTESVGAEPPELRNRQREADAGLERLREELNAACSRSRGGSVGRSDRCAAFFNPVEPTATRGYSGATTAQ
jgi:potassium efflux system protein